MVVLDVVESFVVGVLLMRDIKESVCSGLACGIHGIRQGNHEHFSCVGIPNSLSWLLSSFLVFMEDVYQLLLFEATLSEHPPVLPWISACWT